MAIKKAKTQKELDVDIQMPNPLIFSPQNFSKLEKRLLYLSLEQLKNKQDPMQQLVLFNDYELEELTKTEVSEVSPGSILKWDQKRTVNIPYSQVSKYGDWSKFKAAAKKLTGCKLELSYKSPAGKQIDDVILFVDRAKSEEGNGIRIQYTENGLQLLTHLSKSYSKLPLELILELNSKYSQRLYELLLSKCYGTNSGKWRVTLEEFRKLIGIGEDSSYFHWGSLERTTIKSVQKEFEDSQNKIPLRFRYSPIKKGNKVVEIEFEIWFVSEYRQERLVEPLTSQEDAVLQELVQMNVSEKYRMIIVKQHIKDFYKWNYARKVNGQKINNPAGHLLKTLGLV